ncbi:MAG: hypothetical protein QRY74_02495 [Chlamydia sp.]
MGSLPFLTEISYEGIERNLIQKIDELTGKCLDLQGRKVKVISGSSKSHLSYVKLEEGSPNFSSQALRIAVCATIILPLIAIAVKAMIRSGYTFHSATEPRLSVSQERVKKDEIDGIDDAENPVKILASMRNIDQDMVDFIQKEGVKSLNNKMVKEATILTLLLAYLMADPQDVQLQDRLFEMIDARNIGSREEADAINASLDYIKTPSESLERMIAEKCVYFGIAQRK